MEVKCPRCRFRFDMPLTPGVNQLQCFCPRCGMPFSYDLTDAPDAEELQGTRANRWIPHLHRLPHLSPPRILVPSKATCVLATTPAPHPATGVRVARGMEAIGTPHSTIGSLGPIGHNARRALLRVGGKWRLRPPPHPRVKRRGAGIGYGWLPCFAPWWACWWCAIASRKTNMWPPT